MRGPLPVLLAAIVLFTGACAERGDSQAADPAARKGSPAPDFELESLGGGKVRLGDFRGESPVLVFFWATWCGYCRAEMPSIMALRDRYAPEDLGILAVNLEEAVSTVTAFAARMKPNYTVLLDPHGEVAPQYGVVGIPTFVLVSREGETLYRGHKLTPWLESLIRAETPA